MSNANLPSILTSPLRTSRLCKDFMLSSKDVNFVGYTYKNFEIVNDYQVPGMAELKKKNTKPKRPTIQSLFEDESETSDTADDHKTEGSFLNLLPPQLEVSENQNIKSL